MNNIYITDTKNSNLKRYVFSVLYIILFFFDLLSIHIPLGNYLDELIALGIFLWIILSRKKIKICDISIRIIICCISITIIGVLSNFIFGYAKSMGIIIRDLVGTFKFFLAFIGFNYIFSKNQINVSRKIIKISKTLIVIIFLFGIISLFMDIGMGDIVRYGLRSYKFIFSFYNVMVFAEVILIATLMCENKKNIIYYTMAFISVALTLRTKSIVVIALAIAFILLGKKKNNPIIYGKFTKILKYAIPFAIIILFAVRGKIHQYLSWGNYSSIRIGALIEGWNMLKDHFPFGTGFGTYGTNLSYNTGSVIYSIYNNINYSIMMDSNHGFATMSDTYWPSIYAQFGIIGLLLFLYSLYLCFINLRKNSRVSSKNRNAAIFIFTYMILATFSEATFTNNTGVVSAIMMTLLMNISGKMKKIQTTKFEKEGAA